MSSTKKIIIFSAAALAIIILALVFGIAPLFLKIGNITDKIIAEKKSAISFEEEVTVAEQFEESYENLELNPQNIDNFLASSSAPVDLIKFFEDTARESSLFIEISAMPVEKLEEDLWESIGFRLELSGSFLNFLKFLEKVENGSYFIQIQRVQAEKDLSRNASLEEGSPSGKSVKVILDIKVFTK